MRTFVGILDGRADVWGVRVPDAPGCYGGGATAEEAVASAVEALADLLQDDDYVRATPLNPTPIEALRERPDIKAGLAAGDVLVLLSAPGDAGRNDRTPIAAE
ncbi:type II toxin-antitoxin system HicB family antitoxin [Alsobacter sp. KACC 23698]|uniref:Type II toxin-antitoxin system HicB family antitoxin n=1 Tax=Alsobacter sp. KACC 23698 TaxID=3149229 RepID=A0AAU7JBS0_9HYPH